MSQCNMHLSQSGEEKQVSGFQVHSSCQTRISSQKVKSSSQFTTRTTFWTPSPASISKCFQETSESRHPTFQVIIWPLLYKQRLILRSHGNVWIIHWENISTKFISIFAKFKLCQKSFYASFSHWCLSFVGHYSRLLTQIPDWGNSRREQSISGQRITFTSTQIHKYTNTQVQKYTKNIYRNIHTHT